MFNTNIKIIENRTSLTARRSSARPQTSGSTFKSPRFSFANQEHRERLEQIMNSSVKGILLL